MPELRAYAKIGSTFKNALSNFCKLYNFPEPETHSVFPMYISKALQEVSLLLADSHKELQLRIMQEEGGRVTLATRKIFDTRMTLYYLPLCPLWEMMKLKDKKAETALLLSIVAYLFKVGGIPHFAETYSYFDGIYEMVAEWNTDQGQEQDGEEDAEQEHIAAHFEMMNEAGAILLAQMANPENLKRFKGRVNRFKPKDEKGEDLLNCAKNALKLYRTFPNRSVMDNMGKPALDNEEDTFIRSEQYLSFYWSSNDCLIDSAMDYINAELNEVCEMEEPVSLQYFDAPQSKEIHDFSFEEQFFDLLNEVSDILNDLQ